MNNAQFPFEIIDFSVDEVGFIGFQIFFNPLSALKPNQFQFSGSISKGSGESPPGPLSGKSFRNNFSGELHPNIHKVLQFRHRHNLRSIFMSKRIMAYQISNGKNAQLGIEGLRLGRTNTFEKLNLGIERGGHGAKVKISIVFYIFV